MPSTPFAPPPEVARPGPAVPRPPHRLTAALAVLGAALLVAGTLLHPADADPGAPAAAFAEYAGVSRAAWVAAHLLQLGGVVGMVLVAVLLARAVDGTRGSAWVSGTAVLGTAGLATAAVLQAVDGVALKVVVDLWSDAGGNRTELFAAALAVRSIETGLDAAFALLLSAAFLALGAGLLAAPGTRALGGLALLTAVAAGVDSVALALGGFSSASMLASAFSAPLALSWLLLAAGWSWRRAAARSRTAAPTAAATAAPTAVPTRG